MSNKLTQEQFEVIISLCKLKGKTICSVFIREGCVEYPYIVEAPFSVDYSGTDCEEISINPNNLIIELASLPDKNKTFRLNNEYEAIIYPEHIKVGCQEISHDKIKELYKLIYEY